MEVRKRLRWLEVPAVFVIYGTPDINESTAT